MDALKRKLMTLADGQVLYKDLRQRISGTQGAIIDDESGQGDTDKVWSADKTYNELSSKINEPSEEGTNGQVLSTDGEGGRSWTTVDISNKADKENTVLDTTLSRGRSGTAGTGSFAFGSSVIASGEYSHAEGIGDTGRGALGKADHAEGYQTRANSGSGSSAYGAHAEGTSTTASAEGAHAEGGTTTASAQYSHAEGMATTASGKYSHAEGYVTKATATAAHAEGYSTTASGTYSHAEGMGTVANHAYQHAFGSYNIADPSTASASNRGNYIEIVGKGSASSAKKNARTLDWNGNERLSGDVYVGCNDDSSGGTKLAKITDIPSIPIDDTAGSGDTDKVWSADKLVAQFNSKAPTASPEFTTKIKLDGAEVNEKDLSLLRFDLKGMEDAIKAVSNVGAVKIVVNNMSYAVDNIPAYSIASYVVNGNTNNICNAIYQHLPVGYETYGTTSRTITDGSISKTIYFSRPTLSPVVVYVTLEVPSGYSQPDKIAAMKTNISSYIGSLGIGDTFNLDEVRGLIRQALGNDADDVEIKDLSISTSSMHRENLKPSWDEKFVLMSANDIIVTTETIDTSVIEQAVEDWLDDHPEATTTVQDGSITYAKLNSDLQDSVDDVSELKNAINVLQPTATSGDVGKFLKAKTVADGKVTEYEFGSGGGGGSVNDVQISGTSIVSSGVANIPYASANDFGVLKVSFGLKANNGLVQVEGANDIEIRTGTGTSWTKPIIQNNIGAASFYGLARAAGDTTQKSSYNAVGVYTEDAKSSISEMLNGAVSISGTTPSITAKAGVRYVCGEVSTLTIVVPASGCIDVTFTSGSTATVLTVTPPTGMTMKWANGFDPTALEANTTYEINIMDGCLGVAGSWT